ncbi:alpha-hydroxy acid oxidase [Microlunatus parietis]|uniref:L-lactate dehydrogenase (Cytochrome) n=1 Tax=Microlunatus parietis TaxID=682979 RepID=A0A7Y9I8B5_9ACTN|nr:alpha-hydroxy acid oxidase [Microlunatus parietis]NYE71841.1 L-lactate dehydrogenase (cytochrome) [Microlunatus parietis]
MISRTERRVAAADSIEQLRRIARRRTPRAVFDYTDGAAEEELTLRRAEAALRSVELRPHSFGPTPGIDTSTEILGRRATLPLVLAPTGYTRMMHHEGELAVARAAWSAGLPYTLSTMGTRSIEEVAAECPAADRWFQLYLWRDRAASEDLVDRAGRAGYRTLMLTVDTAVGGLRLRDVRNGLTIPPALTARTLFDGARHPHWWFNFLTTEPLSFASMKAWTGTTEELPNLLFDPTVTLADLAWLRSAWAGPLLIKGIQHADDARAVIDAGADGVIISNHGGRQLDRAATTIDLLPGIRAALGPAATILVDGGFRSGADLAAALTLGADAVMIGRPYLYGLMAGGEAGVRRALEIFDSGLRSTMRYLGAGTITDLTGTRA